MVARIGAHVRTDLRESFRIQPGHFKPGSALRGAAVTTALVIFGLLALSAEAAIALGVGGLFTYLAEGDEPAGRRLRLMLWVSVWLGIASLLGGLVAPHIAAVLIATPIMAALCGYVGAAGSRAALIGVVSLVLFTIAAGLPVAIEHAAMNAALVTIGGLTQTLFSAATALALRSPLSVDQTTSLWQRLSGSWNDNFVRHAIRLTVAVTIATVISQTWQFDHSYWIPMTAAWMTRPDQDGTVTRVLGRLIGTILGLALVSLAFGWTTVGDGVFVVAVGLSAFVAALFFAANYAIAVTGITIFVVTLFALDGDPVQHTAPVRMIATVIAAAIVLPIAFIARPKT